MRIKLRTSRMKGRKGRRCFISSVEICSRFRLTNHRILESRASNYHLPIKKLKSCIGPSKKGCSSRWTELDYRKSSRRCRPFRERERERLWAREREKKGGNKGKESRVGRGERGGGGERGRSDGPSRKQNVVGNIFEGAVYDE